MLTALILINSAMDGIGIGMMIGAVVFAFVGIGCWIIERTMR